MSGLAALLAGRKPAAVYHWSSPMRTRDIRHAGEHAGWRCVVLDTIEAADAAAFHDVVAAAFDLPDWYGRNLDALVDVLRDVAAAKAAKTLVVWEGWSTLANADPKTTGAVVDAFTERARQPSAFAVVLHGPGPDLGLTELDQRPDLPR
jgi:RNAse (barnase) inhibitor barstar